MKKSHKSLLHPKEYDAELITHNKTLVRSRRLILSGLED